MVRVAAAATSPRCARSGASLERTGYTGPPPAEVTPGPKQPLPARQVRSVFCSEKVISSASGRQSSGGHRKAAVRGKPLWAGGHVLRAECRHRPLRTAPSARRPDAGRRRLERQDTDALGGGRCRVEVRHAAGPAHVRAGSGYGGEIGKSVGASWPGGQIAASEHLALPAEQIQKQGVEASATSGVLPVSKVSSTSPRTRVRAVRCGLVP